MQLVDMPKRSLSVWKPEQTSLDAGTTRTKGFQETLLDESGTIYILREVIDLCLQVSGATAAIRSATGQCYEAAAEICKRVARAKARHSCRNMCFSGLSEQKSFAPTGLMFACHVQYAPCKAKRFLLSRALPASIPGNVHFFAGCWGRKGRLTGAAKLVGRCDRYSRGAPRSCNLEHRRSISASAADRETLELILLPSSCTATGFVPVQRQNKHTVGSVLRGNLHGRRGSLLPCVVSFSNTPFH